MATPDGLVRWYCTTRADMGAPGLDPVKARGWIFAARCESTSRESRRARHGEAGPCESDVRHATKTGTWVCGRCGVLWRSWERHQLRGEVQEPARGDGFERARGHWIDVGIQLQRFLEDARWRWESRLYVANANGHTLRWLVRYGPSEFPEAPFPWRKWKLAGLVQAGRAEWMRRLRLARIEFDE